MSILNRTHRVVAFDDTEVNSNPSMRHVDWRRDLSGIPVDLPKGYTVRIDPLAEVALFNASRTLTVDVSTELSISLSPLDTDRYRLSWTGNGTAPGFRTDRGLTLSGGSVTMALQANNTVQVTHSSGAVFSAVQVGDNVFVPGVTTGDPAVFNALNEGSWVVLGASSTIITIARTPDMVFQGVSETVAVSANDQFLAYSITGVQVGDTLDIISNFAVQARNSYQILSVTSRWVEFVSAVPLLAQTLTPGVGSFAIYSDAKRYVYLETDQSVAVKLNGNILETDRVDPFLPADVKMRGPFEKWGLTWSLSVKNRSTASANVFIITAE